MAQQLGGPAALAEELSSVLNIHVRKLRTTFNSNLWPLYAPALT